MNTLKDYEKDMYVFNTELISDNLIQALILNHRKGIGFTTNKIRFICLVPGHSYLLVTNDIDWEYKELIVVTKKQVDKFIQINNVIPMDFIEFIETYKD